MFTTNYCRYRSALNTEHLRGPDVCVLHHSNRIRKDHFSRQIIIDLEYVSIGGILYNESVHVLCANGIYYYNGSTLSSSLSSLSPSLKNHESLYVLCENGIIMIINQHHHRQHYPQ